MLSVTTCVPVDWKYNVMVPSIGLYIAAPCSSELTLMKVSLFGLSTSVSSSIKLMVRSTPSFCVEPSMDDKSRRGASLIGLTLRRMVWSATCSPSLARRVTSVSPLTSSSTVLKESVVPSRSTLKTSSVDFDMILIVNWSAETALPCASVSDR